MARADDWQPPDKLDEYRLIRPLGSGAMGDVHLARDGLLDRFVAVKFIAGMTPSEVDRERFFIEARAVARLQHPNVVTIYRVGEVETRPYIVSEYVSGKRLDKLPSPLSNKQLLDIALGLSRGLAAAHRSGVLHRDIKPENTMISDTGEIKLLDFGLAKLMDYAALPGETSSPSVTAPPAASVAVGSAPYDASATSLDAFESNETVPAATAEGTPPTPRSGSLTRTGAMMGTPVYMAPEIWAGELASARSDVYSLGALLYRIVSGRPPHRAPSLYVLRERATTRDARPLADVAPDVDPEFARIVDRCLSRDPGVRFAHGDAVRDAFEQLVRDVHPSQIPTGNPYRGLLAFESEHRALFFGRNVEVRGIVDRLRAQSFLVVAGDSGVGKSSLCRAGVAPALTAGALGDDREWQAVVTRPGPRPAAALAAALAERIDLSEEAIAAAIADGDLPRELRRALGPRRGLLILVDQLEELATLAAPDEAERFSTALGRLADPSPGLRVVATARGDFLTRLASLPGLTDILVRSLFVLQPLSESGLREAITGPARATGVAFETDELVDQLVAAAASSPGGLPLLQFTLARLWERRDTAKQRIVASALEELGGVAGALSRHADGVVRELVPAQRAAARRIMTQLVTSEATRARHSEAELAGTSESRAALSALVAGRLLVARDAEDGAQYEIAHEALLTSWGSLREWLDTDAEARAVRERLTFASREWDRRGRSSEELWSGRQLLELELIEPDTLSERDAAFAATSRSAARRRRFLRSAALVAVPVLIGAVYGAIRWNDQRVLGNRVTALVAEASAIEDEARGKQQQAATLRERALALFDAGKLDEAERVWTELLALEPQTDDLLGKAGERYERAAMLDPTRPEPKQRAAEVLYRRALLAERADKLDKLAQLRERLRLYDDGSYARRWSAPARVDIETDPPGATVLAARYVEDADGYSKLEPPVEIGASPVRDARFETGSYLLTLSAPGRVEVPYPLAVGRDQRHRLRVYLPAPGQVPDGYAYVPEGEFLFGSSAEGSFRTEFLDTAPLHTVRTKSYLIARTETTFGQYIEFLDALPPEQRTARTPRVGGGTVHTPGSVELSNQAGVWVLRFVQGNTTFRARAGESIEYASRSELRIHDWLELPVFGIDIGDAKAYASWLRDSRGVAGARLCDELEWERAARGADGRVYPHGNKLHPGDANYDATYGGDPSKYGPNSVGSHAASRSPFGVDDMAGNVWEFTRSVITSSEPLARGGAFAIDETASLSNQREEVDDVVRDISLGFRVCADLQDEGS